MIAILALTLSPAHADCAPACDTFGYEARLSLPETQAVGVATTAAPLVQVALDVGLLDPATGLWLDVQLDSVDGNLALTRLLPDAPMPAETLLEVWTRDVDGERLLLLGEFTTGTGPDTEAPSVPTGLAALARSSSGGDCAPAGDSVEATWDPIAGDDAVFYEARFVHPQGEQILTSIGPTAKITTQALCGGLLPALETGDTVEVEVRSVDLSGNASAWSEPVADAVPARGCGCTNATGPAGLGLTGLGAWALLLLRRRTQGHSR